jgi:hypothetical protein
MDGSAHNELSFVMSRGQEESRKLKLDTGGVHNNIFLVKQFQGFM